MMSETPLLDKALSQKEQNIVGPLFYGEKHLAIIERMVSVWGKEKVADYCEMAAFAHREINRTTEALYKEKWYINMSEKLRS